MGTINTLSTWMLCLTLLFHLPLCSGQESQQDPSVCHYRSHWVKWISSGYFDGKQNCGDLNYILQVVNKDKKKMDFCLAERQHVFGYIREGLRPSLGSGENKGKMPEDCEIDRWWYEGKYPKTREAFCKTATRIARANGKKNRTAAAQAQPYKNLIHGPRSQCHNKFREELATIGNPDVAGPGVMASYIIQLLLLVIYCSSAFCPDGSLIRRRAERSFTAFYGTSMVLALSIAIASVVTFENKRFDTTESIHSDFALPEIYEYRLLTLAPAFAILPVLVAHTLHEARQRDNVFRRRQALLPRILTALVCLLCVAVIWVIWGIGKQGNQSPVRFVFGGGFNVQVDDFLYQRAGKYTLAIAILTTALPFFSMISIWVSQQPVSLWPELTFCVICILLALAEVVMLFCIRGMAIKDGQGHSSEIEVGFGQILACFTWFPVLFILISGMEFPGIDDATVGVQQGKRPYQGNYLLQTNAP
ncbi:uncharacterized protein PG998_005246 [Apiospora kogelbergensis]|uniref:uncharacterized protein n=1 Tax=Apiospora kogelbergensis TaxID=1337665 RepID=UPI00312E9358